jgi:hypothetical protein
VLASRSVQPRRIALAQCMNAGIEFDEEAI